jgi:hypothetical protein
MFAGDDGGVEEKLLLFWNVTCALPSGMGTGYVIELIGPNADCCWPEAKEEIG